MTSTINKGKRFEHEVAISYAGEDGEIAEQIAQSLRKNGVSVFYDKFVIAQYPVVLNSCDRKLY